MFIRGAVFPRPNSTARQLQGLGEALRRWCCQESKIGGMVLTSNQDSIEALRRGTLPPADSQGPAGRGPDMTQPPTAQIATKAARRTAVFTANCPRDCKAMWTTLKCKTPRKSAGFHSSVVSVWPRVRRVLTRSRACRRAAATIEAHDKRPAEPWSRPDVLRKGNYGSLARRRSMSKTPDTR
jgi:hypothetical protein